MRFRFPRLRRRGGVYPVRWPGKVFVRTPVPSNRVGCMRCGKWSRTIANELEGVNWLLDHDCTMQTCDVLASCHDGPYDGYVITLHNPGPNDTIRIENDEDPSQPDAVYVPRPGQDDPEYRHFDWAPERT